MNATKNSSSTLKNYLKIIDNPIPIRGKNEKSAIDYETYVCFPFMSCLK